MSTNMDDEDEPGNGRKHQQSILNDLKATASSESTQESNALASVLSSGNLSTDEFFNKVWQIRPKVFPFSSRTKPTGSATDGGDGSWDDERMQEAPLEEIVHQGWHVLTKLLEQIQQDQENTAEDKNIDRFSAQTPNLCAGEAVGGKQHQRPLIFQNKEVQPTEAIEALYGHSLFAPYLNGSSIVLNHADLSSPWIAALCRDLQRCFPHVYANCYLTPPNSQAVPPHADDRDVLVIQVVGSKQWEVFKTVPVPYPYTNEQVGKDGMPVPPNVLDGPMEISTTLKPGDVLYMPRGFVHQAKTCNDDLSFHITVAIATHDWTLARIFSSGTEHVLTRVVDFRRAILPRVCTPNDSSNGNANSDDPCNHKALQSQIDSALDILRKELTAETILEHLNGKLENHNRRAFTVRMQQIHNARFPSTPPTSSMSSSNGAIVGSGAAKQTTFQTILRAATSEEKSSVSSSDPNRPRGLNVREDIGDAIISIISSFKKDPNLTCRVINLKSLISTGAGDGAAPSVDQQSTKYICDLTLLCLAKRCVELGALAIVPEKHG